MSLVSAWRTVFIERAVPYRVAKVWDAAIHRAVPEKTIRAADGSRFRVRRLTYDSDIVTNVVNSQEYFQHGITLQPTDTVVDIGGNIGTFAVTASRRVPQGRVVTIEPEPENLRLLRHKIALNGCRNIEVCPVAVSDAVGTARLHLSQGAFHTVAPSTRVELERPTIPVPTLPLSDIFARHAVMHCHLLKVDCEGAEFQMLRGLGAVATRIDQIAMEYHTAVAGTREELLAVLAGHGFRVLHEDARFHSGHLFARRSD